MITNVAQQPDVSFKAKYPTEKIIALASKTDIRKADAVNLINSITRLTKEEQKAMLRVDNVAFKKYLTLISDWIQTDVPILKKFILKLNNNNCSKEKVYNEAIQLLGDEINIKRLKHPHNEQKKFKKFI